ncbi:hypothetical protein J2T02_000894 [Chitinophaga terrae (ex Kim and Jung 2007)]|uniref:hypothetical protein n=1 Tax=Chitinophaga terrae (ex Kim and Jung 2007) TaxID=408074 RepID=UPI0027823DD0|nr:hypothetical protein [Chitinophaga terrae (ex Kim and Jung 2007)]MDQ0105800.1 hypothetical protein [Chitinophaga terrae (ex Kim and Jung 2007)]
MKSTVLAILDGTIKVVVLQEVHKWVYISYINPADNLAESGWILKKYLIKKEQ